MSHLDEGTLHAMLDGELEPNDVAEIQAHLASCSSCGLRLREVRQFLDEADRLIASVEMDGAAAAPMRRLAPMEGTPELPRLEPPRPEPARREPVREPIRAEPARAEPVAGLRPSPAARPEPSPPRPQPRPVPDRPAGKETWNAPPPPLLMPDNESAADRRMRRFRKYGWAAMVVVIVGAGFIGTRLRKPAQAAFEASQESKAADAIVSPEEAPQPPAGSSDTAAAALATRPRLAKEETPPKSPARADAPRDALKEAPKAAGKLADAGKVAENDAGKDSGGAAEASDGNLAAAPQDTPAPADEPSQDSSGTEDLATVRARAADALADLDRERRRNQAAAATAALDAQRRRRPAAQRPEPPRPSGGPPRRPRHLRPRPRSSSARRSISGSVSTRRRASSVVRRM